MIENINYVKATELNPDSFYIHNPILNFIYLLSGLRFRAKPESLERTL